VELRAKLVLSYPRYNLVPFGALCSVKCIGIRNTKRVGLIVCYSESPSLLTCICLCVRFQNRKLARERRERETYMELF
jgi:hypothetical protein